MITRETVEARIRLCQMLGGNNRRVLEQQEVLELLDEIDRLNALLEIKQVEVSCTPHY